MESQKFLRVKADSRRIFEKDTAKEILSAMEKFREILGESRASLDLTISLLAKRAATGKFSPEEWDAVVDGMQQLKYLEDVIKRLNEFFLKQADNLLNPDSK